MTFAEAIAHIWAEPLFRIWAIGILPSVIVFRAADYNIDAVAKEEFQASNWLFGLIWPTMFVLWAILEFGPHFIRAPNWIVDRAAMILAWMVGRLVKGITK